MGKGAEEAGGGTTSMAAAVGMREPESGRRSGTRGAGLGRWAAAWLGRWAGPVGDGDCFFNIFSDKQKL